MAKIAGKPEYCDLIMEGGITSGVVYPKVVTRLAQRYHFKSVGGTSAGAIAAAFAAAAEFARVTGREAEGAGMAGIDALPSEFGGGVLKFFQPVPALRRLFRLGLGVKAARDNKRLGFWMALKLVQKHYGALLPWPLLVCALALFAVCLWAGWRSGGVWGGLAVLLGMILTVVAAIAVRAIQLGRTVLRDVVKVVPENSFGICSGRSEDGHPDNPGLTDWMADRLDRIAGLDKGEGPLTFRMLQEGPEALGKPGIRLQIMTTNLSLQRPHRLPMDTAIFWFDADEFRKLFPDRIVDHMIAVAKRGGHGVRTENGRDFWPFPGNHAGNGIDAGDDLPVVVAARMSLSFPVLIQAIPLYAVDYGLDLAAGQRERPLSRCWFTDGGASSNFPMHFFDSYLPVIPTFGISLGEHDPRRNGEDRISRPVNADKGRSRPVLDIAGLPDFLGGIINTARHWQDNLLQDLTGFRDRIATVHLTKAEGGLNLDMDEKRIKALLDYGAQAGDNLLGFDLDEHRWRRFLVTYEKVTDMAESLRKVWRGQTAITGEPMDDFLKRYATERKSYKGNTPAVVESMAARFEALSVLAEDWNANPLKPPAVLPRPKSVMRITPEE